MAKYTFDFEISIKNDLKQHCVICYTFILFIFAAQHFGLNYVLKVLYKKNIDLNIWFDFSLNVAKIVS